MKDQMKASAYHLKPVEIKGKIGVNSPLDCIITFSFPFNLSLFLIARGKPTTGGRT